MGGIHDYPLYFVVVKDYGTLYYRVEGPDGPVTHKTPGTVTSLPTTMIDLVMQTGATEVDREETPYHD